MSNPTTSELFASNKQLNVKVITIMINKILTDSEIKVHITFISSSFRNVFGNFGVRNFGTVS